MSFGPNANNAWLQGHHFRHGQACHFQTRWHAVNPLGRNTFKGLVPLGHTQPVWPFLTVNPRLVTVAVCSAERPKPIAPIVDAGIAR